MESFGHLYFPKDETSAMFAQQYLTFKGIEGDMYIVYPEYWTTADQSPIFYIPLKEKLNTHRHVGLYGFFYTPNHKMPSEGVGQIRKLDDEIYCYITRNSE